MRALRVGIALLTALTILSWSSSRFTATAIEIGDQPPSDSLVIRNVKVEKDGAVSGEVYNQSTATLRDIRLVVRYIWLWKKERKPGEDNPGRAVFLRLTGSLPPDTSAPFEYRPDPPLPSRTDGRFDTTVEVSGFSEIE